MYFSIWFPSFREKILYVKQLLRRITRKEGNQMEKYTKAQMEVIEFENEDVITTSGGGEIGGGDEGFGD